MKILADLHHYDLFYSLQLLFENRLQAELYRPIGMEWYEQGYWNVFPHPDTARQYLGVDHGNKRPKDIHGNELPDSACVNLRFHIEDGIYYCADSTKLGVFQRGVTLDKFKEMKFDILLSSIPQHIQPFNKLIQQYQPQAKHVFQVGNAWGHLPGVKNILASTAPFYTPPDINTCFYHQEFDLKQFCFEEHAEVKKKVHSYIHYMNRKDLMNRVSSLLSDFEFKSFGAGMEDTIPITENEALAFKSSGFTWHFKPEGDGYGYTLHRAFATGTIPIVWASQYKGKLAQQLMLPGVTCINADGKNEYQIANEIRSIVDNPPRYHEMRHAAYNRFKEVVDFDKEEQTISLFLQNLK